MTTRHVAGFYGHRYHVTRTPAGLLTVTADDVVTPGAVFDRVRPAPAGELASVAAASVADGERLEPLTSEASNGRTRDTWRIVNRARHGLHSDHTEPTHEG